jgi:lambda family phage portal protein
VKIKFWGGSTAEKRSAPGAALADIAPPGKRRKLFGRSLAQMFKSSLTTDNDRWGGTPTSPDSFITLRQSVLVARSREQWSNNDYVRKFIRLIRQNVVGPIGVTMQAKAEKPRGGLDKESNQAIQAEWLDWGKKGNCDVTGQLSWREVQCLSVETAARDGEFIVRKIYGADAGPHGFAVQMIDPQRLPVSYENYQMDKNGGFVRQGIEFNKYGRPVAYHFSSTDEWDAYYYSYGGRGFVRVPADEIIHGFVHELVGQRRGLPWVSTSLFRLHHLQGFEDAAVQNARAGASKMGFIQYREGFGPEAADDTPLNIEAEPLSFQELPEGAEIKDFQPQYPTGEFQPFHKAMLRSASSGMGVPYNDLANDLEGVNFSSIRQGTLDARENYKELQTWIIETLCAEIYSAWIKYKLLAGTITVKGRPLPAEKLDNFSKVTWQARRWSWIDPRADVQSAIESIRAGLTSISQVIREQGRDPNDVFAEFAADLKLMKEAGIPEETIVLFLTGLPPPPEPVEPPDNSKAAA